MTDAQLLYAALGLIILIANAITAWSVITGKSAKREIGPQPFEIKTSKDLLTKDDHTQICQPLHHRVGHLENEVRAIRLKMDADKQEILASADITALRIHERIDDLQKTITADNREILRALGRLEGHHS